MNVIVPPIENPTNSKSEAVVLPTTEHVFPVIIKLPHEPWKTQIQVSTQEQVQDLRQAIVDQPFAMQYSCFHLEHDGERINDFVELSEVPTVKPNSTLTLVEDPYTEKDARVHIVRIRELIGAAGDRTDTIHGLSAGLSLHDHVLSASINGHGHNGNINSDLDDIANYNFDTQGSIKFLLAPE